MKEPFAAVASAPNVMVLRDAAVTLPSAAPTIHEYGNTIPPGVVRFTAPKATRFQFAICEMLAVWAVTLLQTLSNPKTIWLAGQVQLEPQVYDFDQFVSDSPRKMEACIENPRVDCANYENNLLALSPARVFS